MRDIYVLRWTSFNGKELMRGSRETIINNCNAGKQKSGEQNKVKSEPADNFEYCVCRLRDNKIAPSFTFKNFNEKIHIP